MINGVGFGVGLTRFCLPVFVYVCVLLFESAYLNFIFKHFFFSSLPLCHFLPLSVASYFILFLKKKKVFRCHGNRPSLACSSC